MMAHPSTVADLEQWLSQYTNRERSGDYSDWKLEPMHQCLAALQLHRPLRPITVAGTKGKGSTVAFLEQIFTAHGQPTFSFTSPHITTLMERWRRNGAAMELTAVARHCSRVDQALRAVGHDATYFERCFLLACCCADAEPERIFICEVGLGGRLDCANVLDASCVCLTSLGLDHTHILGPTIAHIAREKLGVCRPHAPLFSAPQSESAAAAIAEQLPPVAAIHWPAPTPPTISLGLTGTHQRDNAGLAWATAQHVLNDAFSSQYARAGLAQARLPARCQQITRNGRDFLIDGAHTSESIVATLHTADALWGDAYRLLFSCASDKDVAGLCAHIGRKRSVFRCAYAWERCVQPDDARWPDFAQCWPWYANVAEALAATSQGQGPLVITGSFYLAGEALAHLSQQDGQP